MFHSGRSSFQCHTIVDLKGSGIVEVRNDVWVLHMESVKGKYNRNTAMLTANVMLHQEILVLHDI